MAEFVAVAKAAQIAEGTVRVAWKQGGFLNAVFCDAFEMENTKIRRLISYLVPLHDRESEVKIAGATAGGEQPVANIHQNG